MTLAAWTRQLHRWIAILFTLAVVANFAAIAIVGEPAMWVYMLPLPPLFLLLFTGLYLFALPYLRRGRTPAE
ncbi:hypothetical protein [Wenxinia marina]|uniref:Transmembrane protein n=1 Tax=Wenxinia marina DSM 24838 TaxID=1123501 RepID=A0A0D0PCD9_9RHOB|nr:hypothetical protein [Wenxinia marina]KIQ69086.1 hypothetical protein Wenmar_02154 [Wenxinia marina DSM 24838]GGL70191.1 hypothetical protein GCM10011392_25960 [Wenxinia marina]